jgi:hypothetical protein
MTFGGKRDPRGTGKRVAMPVQVKIWSDFV